MSTQMDDDESDLLARARAHDPDAWEAIYRRAYPGLVAFARRRLATREQADDAVSEVMARAIGRSTASSSGPPASTVGCTGSFATWCWRRTGSARPWPSRWSTRRPRTGGHSSAWWRVRRRLWCAGPSPGCLTQTVSARAPRGRRTRGRGSRRGPGQAVRCGPHGPSTRPGTTTGEPAGGGSMTDGDEELMARLRGALGGDDDAERSADRIASVRAAAESAQGAEVN